MGDTAASKAFMASLVVEPVTTPPTAVNGDGVKASENEEEKRKQLDRDYETARRFMESGSEGGDLEEDSPADSPMASPAASSMASLADSMASHTAPVSPSPAAAPTASSSALHVETPMHSQSKTETRSTSTAVERPSAEHTAEHSAEHARSPSTSADAEKPKLYIQSPLQFLEYQAQWQATAFLGRESEAPAAQTAPAAQAPKSQASKLESQSHSQLQIQPPAVLQTDILVRSTCSMNLQLQSPMQSPDPTSPTSPHTPTSKPRRTRRSLTNNTPRGEWRYYSVKSQPARKTWLQKQEVRYGSIPNPHALDKRFRSNDTSRNTSVGSSGMDSTGVAGSSLHYHDSGTSQRSGLENEIDRRYDVRMEAQLPKGLSILAEMKSKFQNISKPSSNTASNTTSTSLSTKDTKDTENNNKDSDNTIASQLRTTPSETPSARRGYDYARTMPIPIARRMPRHEKFGVSLFAKEEVEAEPKSLAGCMGFGNDGSNGNGVSRRDSGRSKSRGRSSSRSRSQEKDRALSKKEKEKGKKEKEKSSSKERKKSVKEKEKQRKAKDTSPSKTKDTRGRRLSKPPPEPPSGSTKGSTDTKVLIPSKPTPQRISKLPYSPDPTILTESPPRPSSHNTTPATLPALLSLANIASPYTESGAPIPNTPLGSPLPTLPQASHASIYAHDWASPPPRTSSAPSVDNANPRSQTPMRSKSSTVGDRRASYRDVNVPVRSKSSRAASRGDFEGLSGDGGDGTGFASGDVREDRSPNGGSRFMEDFADAVGEKEKKRKESSFSRMLGRLGI